VTGVPAGRAGRQPAWPGTRFVISSARLGRTIRFPRIPSRKEGRIGELGVSIRGALQPYSRYCSINRLTQGRYQSAKQESDSRETEKCDPALPQPGKNLVQPDGLGALCLDLDSGGLFGRAV
jgi:hypothetical protein